MQTRTVARELALLLLNQISENNINKLESDSIENLLNKALDSILSYWREGLDNCASKLEIAQQELTDSEFDEIDKSSYSRIRTNLFSCLNETEYILNSLSESLEFSRLLALSDQEKIRLSAIERVKLVVDSSLEIDSSLDKVMEGWRLKRLPRIDRDILRLAVVDIINLKIPIPVACNEAVTLANRYSDDQGRKMINGVLRRLQNNVSSN